MSDTLTEQQQRFLDAYLVDPNGVKAALAAGYATASAGVAAHRLLRNDKIQRALTARRTVVSAVAAVDLAWWLQETKATYSEAKQAGQYGAAAKCLEMVGKHLGVMEDRHRVIVEDGEREARVLRLLGVDASDN